ncbi:MAG: YcaO-like family protein [Dongiaceae bacterium]
MGAVSGRGSGYHALLTCVMEAIERENSCYHGNESVCRLSSFPAAKVVWPDQLNLVSAKQQAAAETWNRQVAEPHRLPACVARDPGIDWLAAQSIVSGETVLVPAAFALLRHPAAAATGLAMPDSSGCAAGESLEDAAIRAFLEQVERDAVSIWWYNRLARPEIDPSMLDDALIDDMIAWSKARNRPVVLLDLTHDVGIPVVAAIAADAEGRVPSFGFAAAASYQAAALGALGELLQFEVSQQLRRQRDLHAVPLHWLDWAVTADCRAEPHLVPKGKVSAAALKAKDLDSLDLSFCAESCRRLGLDLLMLDLTRVEIGIPTGIPVVRMVVPGLRPLWPRFAEGRLYQVPYRLGWVTQPLQEDALNPVPILY